MSAAVGQVPANAEQMTLQLREMLVMLVRVGHAKQLHQTQISQKMEDGLFK
jgi:hypothetical protein